VRRGDDHRKIHGTKCPASVVVGSGARNQDTSVRAEALRRMAFGPFGAADTGGKETLFMADDGEIKVYVIEFGDRPYYQLQWSDPITQRKRTKTTNIKRTGLARERKQVERLAAELESQLQAGAGGLPSRLAWAEFRERYEREVVPGLAKQTGVKIRVVFDRVEKELNPTRLRDVTEARLSHLVVRLREDEVAETTIAAYLALFLLETPEEARTGPVFQLEERHGWNRDWEKSKIVSKIGKATGVRVYVNPKDPEKVKYASAHDFRRAFGVRWAARLMPAQLMELMRHESIETTLRFYVGTDAQRTAEAAWAAFEALQRVFGVPFANSFANSATSGGADAAPPEKRPVLENTQRNQTRPGVIRTHDQGIMSPLL